ncbi:MAG: hypothetical protein IPF87_14340 [Gemmatimonadetes bacterium]|nr:hypothetical protein [Gemmatimonadota bacterium]MBK6842438.1 hypothetical protein [Gemmatimonadota bacterium]MBK7830851.1 hypothetical protein [Gemmatimonadota bacterium]
MVLTLVAIFLLGEIPRVANLLTEWARCDRANIATSKGCCPPEERSYFAMSRWVRDSTPADVFFLASKEAAFFSPIPVVG